MGSKAGTVIKYGLSSFEKNWSERDGFGKQQGLNSPYKEARKREAAVCVNGIGQDHTG